MWANWLKNYIPRTAPYHMTGKTLVHPQNGDDVSIQKRTGDFHSRRIYCVCRACNNGWMSRLQEEAKPFLVPMLEGREITLHKKAQRLLAAWTAVMVMVAEYAEPDMIAVPASDRAFFREERKPPQHWRIWIGSHRNQSFPLYSHMVSEFVEKKTEVFSVGLSENPNTQATTICVGDYLVIYIMSSIIGRDLFKRWVLPVEVRSGMHQIWPHGIHTGDLRWRSAPWLTDAGVALLAKHFLDKAAAIAARG